MIIICYQGIDKSNYCKSNKDAINLESSHFFKDNNERPEEWYNIYAKIALDLSNKGFVVFVSSHDVVRKAINRYNRNIYAPYLSKNKGGETVVAICPSIKLKDQWIERLSDRYLKRPIIKNHKALQNAIDRYEESIKEIAADIKNTVYIEDLENYDCFKFFDDVIIHYDR